MSTNNRCPNDLRYDKTSIALLDAPELLPRTISDIDSRKTQITTEDQEAKFKYEFNSCRQRGYSEFYLKT